MKILITGGTGFIGSALVHFLIENTQCEVFNVDKLTYAANPDSLKDFEHHPRYAFERRDICDASAMARIFSAFKPDAVIHLAAESHVDRSIEKPGAFIQTNIVGAYTLLEMALGYWRHFEDKRKKNFRFIHVSTDE